ncbi:protein Aster-A [Protopterus annectens]|uniref:protein Aster-A n=1 Tax=Protopterus annectens TaxID=7888 RepID=UPI001CFB1930|nr:protein Aster-A [Protopterus annectens]
MFDTANNSPRSTPASSPAVRRRLLLPSKTPDGDIMVEKGSESSTEKTPTQSLQNSLPGYPLPCRNVIKNPKKMQSWYNVLSPTYKQRNEDFRKIFKKLPETERLIVDYSCALQKDILLQGRLYLSENWLCFYSNIFRWETTISIQLKDITCITKEKTAKLIPNALQISTENEKHFFTSLAARDRSYQMIFRLWQNALLNKTLSSKELWHIVHQCYGTELGLTSDDEDYVSPNDEVNGLGNGEDSNVDQLDVSDHSCNSSLHIKLEASPQADRKNLSMSQNSVDSNDSIPLFVNESDGLTEGQMDVSSSRTVTPVMEERKVVVSEKTSSVDVPNDDDIPTDLSDSSISQDEAEVQSFCTDLNGKLVINTVYQINVDKLYQILFTPSQFMQDFFDQRKFTDLIMKPWGKDNTGNQTRSTSYTIAVNNPLGPKTAPVTETQVWVSSEIRYRKQPWNLVKTLIEKNTWNGIEDYFHHLESELLKAEKLMITQGCIKENGLPSLRRRKCTLNRKSHHETHGPVGTLADQELSSRAAITSGILHSRQRNRSQEMGRSHNISLFLLIISFMICVSLVVLVILNMMLFYRMWSLEHTAQTLESWQAYALSEGKFPKTAVEWAKILELQKRFHNAEVQKWKQILKASVGLLDEMKFSLEKLHSGITAAEPVFDTDKSKEEFS